MTTSLKIPQTGAVDFLALGALIHRLDPGIVPFRKASSCAVHVSGGEFNCTANLADCFGMRTAIATAMVEYPIGELIAGQVRAMGVTPFYKMFTHDGVRGPNMAAVYSDRGFGVRGPGRLLQPRQRSGGAAEARRLRLEGHLRRRRPLVPQRRHLRVAVGNDRRPDHRGDAGGEGARRGRVVRPELPREAVERRRGRRSRGVGPRPHRRARRRARRQRGGPAEGARHRRARRSPPSRSSIRARSST